MPKLTPRFAFRILLPASYLVFLGGALVSGAIFYHGRAFDAKAAIVSDLESPDDNPHGYALLAACIVGSAILLVPVVAFLYQQLRRVRPVFALAGTLFFAVGLAAEMLIGILAPFTHGYSLLHDQLAATVFLGICVGTAFDLTAARAAPVLLVVQWAVVVVVACMGYLPVEYDNSHLFSGLAFWEWGLCAYCGTALLMLAWRIEVKAAKVGRGQFEREQSLGNQALTDEFSGSNVLKGHGFSRAEKQQKHSGL